jgi:CubicO group peptidase (beta-lactamase class C family)
MLKLTAVAVAVLLLLHPFEAGAQQPAQAVTASQPLAASLEALVAPYFKLDAPGAAIIVVKDGKTLLRKAYGMADTGKAVRLTPETSFRLGSITKQFTAVAILMLAEEGKLSLGDPLTRFFPDYPAQGKTVTVEHLLTHTSGIPSYTNKQGYMANMAQDMSVAQMVDSFKNDPLEFAPGSKFSYNNSGYFLLGAIVEKVTGQPYARFLEQRIFEPLGMVDTAYEGFERAKGPRAAGHSPREKGYAPAAPLSMSQPYAAGALVSTVDDLAKWDAAIAGGKLLKPASWSKAFTPYKLASGESTHYGYGWGIGSLAGATMVEHGGGINGFVTHALRLPDQKVFVAVLVNNDRPAIDPAVVTKKAAALAMGKPFVEHKEIALEAKALDAFSGTFENEKGEKRIFRRRDGALTMKNKQMTVPLKAYSAVGFFVPERLNHVEFARNDKGEVTHLTAYHDGNPVRYMRTGDVPPERQAVRIENAGFDARAGSYALAPNFALAITREGDRYFAQATGQPKLEIFPASADRFFSRDIEAELRFEKGEGDAPVLVLSQHGREMRANRSQ